MKLLLVVVMLSATTAVPQQKELHDDDIHGLETTYEMEEIELFPEEASLKTAQSIGLRRRHPLHFNITLTYFKKTLPLRLSMNTVTTASIVKLISYSSNGTLITDDDNEDCSYYQGIGRIDTEISATLSLCDAGLEGIVSTEGKQMMLEPSKSHLQQMVTPRNEFVLGPHSLTDANPTEAGNYTFVHVDIPDYDTARPRSLLENPLHISKTKYVEMYLVNDKSMFTWLGSNKQNNMKRMKQIANVMDSLYQPLNIRIVLKAVEIWNDRDQIHVDKNIENTLNTFLQYRRVNIYPRFKHDNALLITRVDFEGSKIGLAFINGMCRFNYSGSVNQDISKEYWRVAAVMTHEMGHNLGMDNDSPSCHCSDRRGYCIMSSSGTNLVSKFSSCSIQDLERYLKVEWNSCLLNVPVGGLYYNATKCGNNMIDPGEECDCGQPQFCMNTCCNSHTCKLKDGKQCSVGRCCRDCVLSPKGTVCRRSYDQCDLQETCDGIHSQCPENIYRRDGNDCHEHNMDGYCYQGACKTRTSQCKWAWGDHSMNAHHKCYTLNLQGKRYGNCGTSGGHYVKCKRRDMFCGQLYCDRPDGFPIIGVNRARMYDYFNWRGQRFICVWGSATMGPGQPDPFSILDGTRCGNGKACKNSKCVPVAQITGPPCPGNCNGHGNCTNKAVCICEEGYFHPDCKATYLPLITTPPPTAATTIITSRKPFDQITLSHQLAPSNQLTHRKQKREAVANKASTMPCFQILMQAIMLSLLYLEKV